MQQELPNLVDERRFRKREPDYERDELGRVSWTNTSNATILIFHHSENGPKRKFRSIWKTFPVSTFERRWLVKVVLMSNTFSKRRDVEYK